MLAPATRLATIVVSAQVSQLPVGLNAAAAAITVPLTAMLIGRFTVEPLA